MSAIQRKRNFVKDSLATYFKGNGISEILPARPSDEQHPYIRLCLIGEIEVGLYLSDRGVVWIYLCVIGLNRDLDAKVISACKGEPINVCLKEDDKQSRKIAKIERAMDWQQLTAADYGILKNDCELLIDVVHRVYGW